MSYNRYYQDLAKVLQETYKNKDSRKKELKIGGTKFVYIRDMSRQRFCYYESDNLMIFSVHGADNISLNLTAIKKYFNENSSTTDSESICKQYVKILPKIEKEILVIAHSLGCFISSECQSKTKIYPSVFFAPYIPNQSGYIVEKMLETQRFKKLIYDTDPFAKNGIEIKNKKNVYIFHDDNLFFKTTSNGGHSISNFATSKPQKDLIKVIPK